MYFMRHTIRQLTHEATRACWWTLFIWHQVWYFSKFISVLPLTSVLTRSIRRSIFPLSLFPQFFPVSDQAQLQNLFHKILTGSWHGKVVHHIFHNVYNDKDSHVMKENKTYSKSKVHIWDKNYYVWVCSLSDGFSSTSKQMTLNSHFASNTVFWVESFSNDARVLRPDCFKIHGAVYILSAAKM